MRDIRNYLRKKADMDCCGEPPYASFDKVDETKSQFGDGINQNQDFAHNKAIFGSGQCVSEQSYRGSKAKQTINRLCQKSKTKHALQLAIILLLIATFLLPVFAQNKITARAETAMSGSSAQCMVTIESSTNRVLYAKNMHIQRPMASVTKILTAITVLENCENLEQKRKIPKSAVGIEGSSIYLCEGEEISALDLLYGLMLQSGNDCAVALAIITAGSIEGFSAKMNETAIKSGAKNSSFVNPHGLHDDNHYTTAYDLALITSYAMKNPIFKEITSTKSRKIERTRQDAPTLILNKNKLLSGFEGADGVKTGFTKRAGRCLVSSATRDGMQVITVVLNCGPMFEECAALMSRAFREFRLVRIAAAGEPLVEIPIVDGEKPVVRCGVNEDLFYPLREGETVKASVEIYDGNKANHFSAIDKNSVPRIKDKQTKENPVTEDTIMSESDNSARDKIENNTATESGSILFGKELYDNDTVGHNSSTVTAAENVEDRFAASGYSIIDCTAMEGNTELYDYSSNATTTDNNASDAATDDTSAENSRIKVEQINVKALAAPIKKDTNIGLISFRLDNRLLFSRGLFTIEGAPAMPYSDFLDRIIGEW